MTTIDREPDTNLQERMDSKDALRLARAGLRDAERAAESGWIEHAEAEVRRTEEAYRLAAEQSEPLGTECPSWCDIDHEEQQRALDLHANFPEDREPYHSRQVAMGIETDSHGPLYSVSLERPNNSDGTHLWAELEAVTLSADQAEVFGLALIRAAHMLRTCPDASDDTRLTNYWDGHTYVHPKPAVLKPTAAEIALGSL